MSAGHNSIAGERLRSFIERIERLNEEKAALTADTREVFSEAKAAGFDTKVMRRLIAERKLDPQDNAEQQDLLTLYREAIAFDNTPLGGGKPT